MSVGLDNIGSGVNTAGSIRALRCSILSLMILGALGGCASPNWQSPAFEVPAQWDSKLANPSVYAQSDQDFWQSFGDQQLDGLQDEAMQKNADLAQATVRLRKAGLAVTQRQQDREPSINIGGSASGGWQLDPVRHKSEQYGLSAGMSWELDLWGRLADIESAAQWREKASESDLAGLRQSIASDVAAAYWRIARDQSALELLESELARSHQLQRLVNQRYNAGTVSGLDVSQARANVLQLENRVSSAKLTLDQSRWALGILLDRTPQSTSHIVGALPAKFPDVRPQLPAEVLERRPDLAAATANLRAAFADQEASRKSWYPKLSLTGSLGSSSSQLVEVLSNPVVALGANLALPFIQWREQETALQVSKADYEIAVIQYRQKLLAALLEVENALSSRSQLQEQWPRLEKLLNETKVSEHQTILRYEAGSLAFDSVLTARSKRQLAELELLQARYQLAMANVQVYKALGGSPL